MRQPVTDDKSAQGSLAFIPCVVTMAGTVCGIVSASMSVRGDYTAAGMLILAAMLADIIDGASARALGASSELGANLDSLSDLVAFGVAPAALLYHVGMFHVGNWGILFAVVWILAVQYRLARFNIDKATPSDTFIGLAAPAGGVTAVAVTLWIDNSTNPDTAAVLAVGTVLVLAPLMISTMRWPSLRNVVSPKPGTGRWPLLLLLPVAVGLALNMAVALTLLAGAYVAIGPIFYAVRSRR